MDERWMGRGFLERSWWNQQMPLMLVLQRFIVPKKVLRLGFGKMNWPNFGIP